MGKSSQLADHAPSGGTAGAVVYSLSRAVRRPCVRPACPSPAGATLSFDYTRREAWVDVLAGESDPGSYDLCASHVARTRAPQGWRLRDRRPPEDRAHDTPPIRSADLDSRRTVAVIAAALRAVPALVPEHEDVARNVETAREDAGVTPPGGGPPERPSTSADRTDKPAPSVDERQRHRVARRGPTPVQDAGHGAWSADDRTDDATNASPLSLLREADLTVLFATDW